MYIIRVLISILFYLCLSICVSSQAFLFHFKVKALKDSLSYSHIIINNKKKPYALNLERTCITACVDCGCVRVCVASREEVVDMHDAGCI